MVNSDSSSFLLPLFSLCMAFSSSFILAFTSCLRVSLGVVFYLDLSKNSNAIELPGKT